MIGNESADSVSELLGADHRRLDEVFADTKRLYAAGSIADAQARFAVFREGLLHHIEAEEQLLFPAFDELTGTTQGGPTAVMRSEHVELTKLMSELADTLTTAPEDGTTPFASLTALIFAHNGKEERILYPTTDRLANESGGLADLVSRLREF